MLANQETKKRIWVMPVVAAACFAAVGLSAVAVRGAVADRRITAGQADALAAPVRKGGLPILHSWNSRGRVSVP